jgi:hypothetical protein
MPYLMVNLDDFSDMQRSMRQLRRRLRWHRGGQGGCRPAGAPGGQAADRTPLKQKLMRIKQRGVWRFLVGIARLDETPRSLAEIDDALDLPRNKMRSTKAIFAKLENRLDLRFLKLADDAGEDEAGNPRYVMPKRIRRTILELADQ